MVSCRAAMDEVTILDTISYLDQWSWRTWTLVQSLNARIVELEGQVESLQQDVNVLRAQVGQSCTRLASGTGSNELGGGRDRSRDRRRH